MPERSRCFTEHFFKVGGKVLRGSEAERGGDFRDGGFGPAKAAFAFAETADQLVMQRREPGGLFKHVDETGGGEGCFFGHIGEADFLLWASPDAFDDDGKIAPIRQAVTFVGKVGDFENERHAGAAQGECPVGTLEAVITFEQTVERGCDARGVGSDVAGQGV